MQLYQAESNMIDLLSKTREQIMNACKPYMNRPVRIETIDGEVHVGVIVHVDLKHVYIQPMHRADQDRAYSPYGYGYPGYGWGYPGYGHGYPGYGYNPYASTILPLALFDLLAIALI